MFSSISDLECQDLAMLKDVKHLGSGASANVYLVEDDDHTQFAIKYLNSINTKDEIQEFLDEVGVMSILDHPCILQMVAYQMPDLKAGIHHASIVMEYAPNGSLRNLLDRGDDFDRIGMVWEIARGMSYMHSKGYMHRDLKPENILLDRRNHPKISDFGLARKGTGTKTKGQGTVSYMAPEVVLDSHYGFEIDVFSFGQMAYEILTGEPLFDGLNEFKIFNAIIEGRLPKFPDDFEYPKIAEIIDKCRSININERPTFAEVEQQLSVFVKPKIRVKRISVYELMNEYSNYELAQIYQSSVFYEKNDFDALIKENLELEAQLDELKQNETILKNVLSSKREKISKLHLVRAESKLEFKKQLNDIDVKIKSLEKRKNIPFATRERLGHELLDCVQNGKGDRVKELIEDGANLYVKDKDYNHIFNKKLFIFVLSWSFLLLIQKSLVHYAVKYNQIEILNILIENGVNLNIRDSLLI